MGYVLDGGPQDGEYVEELPAGYVRKSINGGGVPNLNQAPATRGVWTPSPKDAYTEQVVEEEYDSYGEGARRELFDE